MQNKIRTGILLFLLFTTIAYAAIILIFFKSVPKEFHLYFNFYTIAGIIATFLIFQFFNILRVHELAKIFTKDFTFEDSSLFTLGGILLALITPFQSGGMPFQMFLFKRKNVSLGASSGILMMRGLQSVLVFLATLPFTMFSFSYLFKGKMVEILLKYFLSLYITIGVILVILLVFTKKLKTFFADKPNTKFYRVMRRIMAETENFKSSILIFFRSGLKHTLISTLWTFISLYAGFSMAYFITLLVGSNPQFFLVFNIQMILTYLTAFIPTPGSSGVAEGGTMLFYSSIVEKNSILIFIFISRVLTTYIPSLLGYITVLSNREVRAYLKKVS